MRLPNSRIKTTRAGALYAFPQNTQSTASRTRFALSHAARCRGHTEALIPKLNLQLRGWGEHYKRAHVRGLFQKLDRWIVRRLWAHRSRRWRSYAWRKLPIQRLYGELKLVSLRELMPSIDTLPTRQRESCAREIRTRSLGGGRRRALQWAPPPTRQWILRALECVDVRENA